MVFLILIAIGFGIISIMNAFVTGTDALIHNQNNKNYPNLHEDREDVSISNEIARGLLAPMHIMSVTKKIIVMTVLVIAALPTEFMKIIRS